MKVKKITSMRRVIQYKDYRLDIDADRFICSTCGDAFITEDEIIEHLEIHKEVK